MKENDPFCTFYPILNGNHSYRYCMVFTACLENKARIQARHQKDHPLSQKLREALSPQIDTNCLETANVPIPYENPHDPDHDIHSNDLSLLVLWALDPVSLQFVIQQQATVMCTSHSRWDLLQLTEA